MQEQMNNKELNMRLKAKNSVFSYKLRTKAEFRKKTVQLVDTSKFVKLFNIL